MQISGLLRQVMHSTVNIGVHVVVLVGYGFNHATRFLGCGGIVEIDKRTTVNLAAEYREVFSYFVYVEHCKNI